MFVCLACAFFVIREHVCLVFLVKFDPAQPGYDPMSDVNDRALLVYENDVTNDVGRGLRKGDMVSAAMLTAAALTKAAIDRVAPSLHFSRRKSKRES